MQSPQDDTAARTEDRLVNLEIKASYTEDLLDSLNEVVVRQQRQIDLLLRELARLAEHGPTAEARTPVNPRDELPPHY
jgi:SlyX protein